MFDETFSYPSTLGNVISFKVNDRKFLEFVEDRQAGTRTCPAAMTERKERYGRNRKLTSDMTKKSLKRQQTNNGLQSKLWGFHN